MPHHAPFSVQDIQSAVEQGREAERARIVALLSDNDADIWHSENFQQDLIALIKGDSVALTWSKEVQEMKKEWSE